MWVHRSQLNSTKIFTNQIKHKFNKCKIANLFSQQNGNICKICLFFNGGHILSIV